MLEELGISFGTALILLIALYYVVKNGVKNGMKQAWRDITGEKTAEEKQWEAYADQFQRDCEEANADKVEPVGEGTDNSGLKNRG